jgi:NhaP-type Na+/H+ or K+/H+ antiporter
MTAGEILPFILAGALFVVMALATSVLQRLPLSTSLLYLATGYAVGPAGLGLLDLDPLRSSALLERITEVAVIVSLFTAGLKLRLPLTAPARGRGAFPWPRLHPAWRPALRLATLSMVITAALVAGSAWWLFGLPLGAAVLLGAILAPTDPVLASDVQVDDPSDRDRLRFSLTGEAGLNDGTAFPLVMLGLGLLGLHELGPLGARWLAVDVVWGVLAGLLVGGLLGTAVSRLVLYLRREHREAVGLDDFLALGLIFLAYGAALLAHGYGFLAVFAAGLALRRVERRHTEEVGKGGLAGGPGGTADVPPPDVAAAAAGVDAETLATDPEKAPAYMAQAVLGFNEQLERIGEVAVVILLGAMISSTFSWSVFTPQTVAFVAILLLILRPLAVSCGLLGSDLSGTQRALIGWFGIRGIGSLYYLMYAIQHGLPDEPARTLANLTLATVAVSIVVHGVSVTPLMGAYRKRGA